MSDKRATYVIGAVVVAVALVFGLITAIPATSGVTVNSSQMGMMGHAVVVLKDTDGNIKAYRQSDNVVTLNGQDCAADLIFGTLTDALCNDTENQFTFIEIGADSTTALDTDTSLLESVTGLSRTGNLIADSAAISGTGATKTIEGTFTLIADTTVAEVGLFDGASAGDDMFSRIVLDTAISAGFDDTVTITYVIEVG